MRLLAHLLFKGLLLCGGATQVLAQIAPIADSVEHRFLFPPHSAWFNVDANGDRYPDFFSPTGGGTCSSQLTTHSALFRNRGDGRWDPIVSCYPGLPTMDQLGALTFRPGMGDFDGDGDVDFVLGYHTRSLGRTGPDKFLVLNRGDWTFQETEQTRLPNVGSLRIDPEVFATLDVERDGDLDLVVGYVSYLPVWGPGPVHIYLNDGRGWFTDATATVLQAAVTLLPSDIQAGDFDRDGWTDLVFIDVQGPRFLLKNQQGVLVSGQSLPWQMSYGKAKVVDLDADGWLDVITSPWQGPLQYFRNDGSGRLVDESHRFPPYPTYSANYVETGDLDRDGRLDLTVGNQVLLQDAAGTFRNVTSQIAPGLWFYAGVSYFLDVDRDGDIDLLYRGYQNMFGHPGSGVALNLRSQLYGSIAGSIGQPYLQIAFGQPGELLYPMLGDTRVTLEIPGIGPWLVDPARMIPLPPFVVGPGGAQSRSFTVPADPTLQGRTFQWQGVRVEPGNVLRSTNWYPMRIQ
ncbi:MAG: VCBS repeat-containing protein [Planctomycetes bacterium]|nr:VCBS repeat-containing protein [Planctomycetota bacterium]